VTELQSRGDEYATRLFNENPPHLNFDCGVGSPRIRQGGPVTLLNVSYDPTRELYEEYTSIVCFATAIPAGEGCESDSEIWRSGPS
jgi:hypothetical protein